MFRHLPSLPALRTFEAVARTGSFKRAAEELGVTATAVSHQVRSLEDKLGQRLFDRTTRSLRLTESGALLEPVMHSALSRIRDGIESVASTNSVVTVTTTPSFAALVLAPQLSVFHAAHPEIDIQLHTSTGLIDLTLDRRIDIAVRYGFGGYEPLHSVELAAESFIALGSQDTVSSIKSLSGSTLFETDWQQEVLQDISWSGWLEKAGVAARDEPANVMKFEEEHYGLHAAIAGRGLVLASTILAQNFITGQLLVPYREEIKLKGAHYFALCLPERLRSKRVNACLDWLSQTLQ